MLLRTNIVSRSAKRLSRIGDSKKEQNLDIMGCWGWIKEAKKPSNPNLYLKIGARKVKRRKGFLEIGHSALTANFIDF